MTVLMIIFGFFFLFFILPGIFDMIVDYYKPKIIKRNCNKGKHDYVTEPMDDDSRKRIFRALGNKKNDPASQYLYKRFMNGEMTLNWQSCKHCGHKSYDIEYDMNVINKQEIRDKKIDELLS